MLMRKLESDEAFLAALGSRARQYREQACMTRKTLAQKSGLSERYLAQLESGQGNLSILLLRKLAMALNRPLEAFLSNGADSPGLEAVLNTLRPLAGSELQEAARLLQQRFPGEDGQTESSGGGRKGRRVALLGMRGVGKTSLGRLLSGRTGRNFIELDREIEKALKLPLADIFSVHGQDAFRRAQLQTLKSLVERHDSFVLTTGGSLVEDAESYDYLRDTCFTVWLTAEAEDHFHRVIDQGDLRPMTGRRGAMNELKALLAKREPLYSLSDACINTSVNSIEQSLNRLLQLVGRH